MSEETNPVIVKVEFTLEQAKASAEHILDRAKRLSREAEQLRTKANDTDNLVVALEALAAKIVREVGEALKTVQIDEE